MARPFLLLIVMLTQAISVFAQGKIGGEVWEKLAETKYAHDGKAKFSKSIKALNGKEVQVKGYLYPLSQALDHQHFILTSLPTSACYFCGVGGPETIMEVLCLEGVRTTKKPILLKGTLVLNPDDPDHLSVMLIDAKLKKR